MLARVASVVVAVGLTLAAFAQEIPFPAGAAASDETLAAAMPAIAEQLLASNAQSTSEEDLDRRFRPQLVAGHYADALQTLAALRAMRPAGSLATTANVRWEIFAKAKMLESEGQPFADAFRKAFRETLRGIDDETAFRVIWTYGTRVAGLEKNLADTLARVKDATTLSTADALDLNRRFLDVHAYRSFSALADELGAEDDARRYAIDKAVPVKMPDGGTVCAVIARPRTEKRLPALLDFTIYAEEFFNVEEARRSASNGYIGIVGLVRGKGCSPDKPVPYERDSADAAALVDWIAAQPWSDGRVGMFGGSYNGGAAWGAAKRMPKALKGIMTGAPVAPGIDVPMEGNVFWNFVYPFTFYTMNNKTLDNATYFDSERWQKLDRAYYTSGRAYRDLEKIDGTPNPGFATWIAHPSYDAYWRSMIPYEKEFARVNIPVLTTAGYYFGGPGAATYYFREHYKYRPNAEHYLVIGPYDHVRGHSGTLSVVGTKTMTNLSGYTIEPNAHIDMPELRYQWFDYVFGKGPKPAILADKVNYAVVGANTWKHAPSIAAMSDTRLRLYLWSGGRLGRRPAEGDRDSMVNLADRSNVDAPSVGGGVIDKAIDTSNGLVFITDPFDTPTEASGLFSGHLDFITNKKDFDFQVVLYELTKSGDYVLLAPYWARASYNGHLGERRLLTPGKRQRLDFESVRLMSRQLAPGSRIVMVLSVIKEVGRQINYGTGKDVSDETIGDAGEPLSIRWSGDSYIEVPIRRTR
ncbi:MAG TPA: CocE/NonD family hydrolase [Thermoanaerobaculia bacterium]|nr:CocE/NonD family hydrolase [Thermoanaerobaculia bacterium]